MHGCENWSGGSPVQSSTVQHSRTSSNGATNTACRSLLAALASSRDGPSPWNFHGDHSGSLEAGVAWQPRIAHQIECMAWQPSETECTCTYILSCVSFAFVSVPSECISVTSDLFLSSADCFWCLDVNNFMTKHQRHGACKSFQSANAESGVLKLVAFALIAWQGGRALPTQTCNTASSPV